MGGNQRVSVLSELCKILASDSGRALDADLLDRFVTARDEAAFEELVVRHERLVFSVCQRLLRRQQDVEDAFQATFLVLACKAGSIGKQQALPSWLYKVAFRIALRERAQRTNRWQHELPNGTSRFDAAESNATGDDLERQELHRVLDEEVHRLPEKYRAPLVLCYYGGHTNEQAAREMGCPVGTVVTRLARARQRLRFRLARRGLALSAGAMTIALVPIEAAPAARLALRDLTIKAALPFAARQAAAGLVSARVAALTQGTITAMTITKLKMAALVLLLVGLLGTGTGLLTYRAFAAEQPAGGFDDSAQLARLSISRPVQDDQGEAKKKANPAPKTKEEKNHADDSKVSAKEILTHSFKTGKAPRLVVGVFNGSIEVVAKDQGTIEATVTKEGKGETDDAAKEALKSIEVKFAEQEGTFRITARRTDEDRKHQHTQASVALTIPPYATVELGTSNGGVKLTNGSGSVNVKTSNGAIMIKDHKGALRLDTNNGAITVSGADSKLDLATHNGPVQIQGNKTLVTATTSNGSIHFSGSLADGNNTMTTSNGAIELTLPGDAQFKIEADTSHGRIRSDFGNTDVHGGKLHWDGSVGKNPAVAIKLHTSNGGITVLKKKAAE
jgi:RNA polymerase sigma factor (sigma-70 family)